MGGLDNALRLDQLSIIDGGNKLTRIPAMPAREFVFPSPSSSSWWSVVASWLPAASCPRPETDEPGGATLHNDFVQRVRERSVIISDRSLDCIIQLT